MISLSTSDEPNASATILVQGSPPTSDFFYDEFHQMGIEGSGSSTALAVGMAAAATVAYHNAAANAAAASAASAPVTPVTIKTTPDFFENENKLINESHQTPLQSHPPRRSTTDIDRLAAELPQP
uniref:Uncharacterized protein n=1 Tax=Panagrolaimus superbus TaxID=310955 RepID=A0A914XTS6_9BILA